jgi:excisionase family DNA binding protein/putative nucleotidyltransferase with HDIG domain
MREVELPLLRNEFVRKEEKMALHAHRIEVTDQNAAEVATRRTKDTVSPANSSDSELLTPRQAARLLGVTFQTVKNYIHRGRLKTYRTPGGHHRIRREDLIALGLLEGGPSKEEIAENYNELHHGYIKTLTALTDALDARDGIVSGHCRRVFTYVALMADTMDILEKQKEEIKLGALLHDIGKVFISEHILSKPGRLTDQEHYFIRQHPEMGEKAISDVEFLQEVKSLIRHHHERFDGKGYPDGLSGEEIPLGARMIAVAEAFDCITRECTFQRTRGLDEAATELGRHAGTQFDPDIVKIFLEEVVSKLGERDIDQSGNTDFFHDGGGTGGVQHSGGSE